MARTVLVLAAFGASLFALDLKSLKPQGYVSDFAHVLDTQSRVQLEAYCARIEQATGVQMAFVTLPSLDGNPIEDVTNDLFRQWGVGKKGKDEGIMLLLAVQEHRDRIEVGYGLEPILPDGFDGSILRGIRPLLRQGSYGQAMMSAAVQMGAYIGRAKGVTPTPERSARDRNVSTRHAIPLPLIIIGIILLIFILRSGVGGFLAGMILGNLLGSGRRDGDGWGGGGFGSGGGGGGFGGFGGGDSGGGGASSDW